MTIWFAEQAVNTILSYLQTSLGPYLAQTASGPPGGPPESGYLPLDPIASWHVAEIPPGIVQCPAIAVIAEQTHNLADEWYAGGRLESGHDITIAVGLMDADHNALRRRLYRYLTAILRAQRAAQQNTAFGGALKWEHQPDVMAQYSPVMIPVVTGARMFGDARLLGRVWQEERD